MRVMKKRSIHDLPSEDEYYSTEEKDQERRFTKRLDEASEAPGSNKKRNNENKQTEKDIEKEYSKESQIPKRKRPRLETKDVTGPKGLIRIRNEFPKLVKYRSKGRNFREHVLNAAIYGQSILDSYRLFCYDLFAHKSYEDVLNRIETFGSKKEVKEFLNEMRMQMRKEHLTRVYGYEKTERMLCEIDSGTRIQDFPDDPCKDNTPDFQISKLPSSSITPEASPNYSHKKHISRRHVEDDDSETEMTFQKEEINKSDEPLLTSTLADNLSDKLPSSSITPETSPNYSYKKHSSRRRIEDDDSETEMTFQKEEIDKSDGPFLTSNLADNLSEEVVNYNIKGQTNYENKINNSTDETPISVQHKKGSRRYIDDDDSKTELFFQKVEMDESDKPFFRSDRDSLSKEVVYDTMKPSNKNQKNDINVANNSQKSNFVTKESSSEQIIDDVDEMAVETKKEKPGLIICKMDEENKESTQPATTTNFANLTENIVVDDAKGDMNTKISNIIYEQAFSEQNICDKNKMDLRHYNGIKNNKSNVDNDEISTEMVFQIKETEESNKLLGTHNRTITLESVQDASPSVEQDQKNSEEIVKKAQKNNIAAENCASEQLVHDEDELVLDYQDIRVSSNIIEEKALL